MQNHESRCRDSPSCSSRILRGCKVSCANWAHCCGGAGGGKGEGVSLGHSPKRQWYENARRRRELPTPQGTRGRPMPRICNSVEGVHRQAGWPKHQSERDGVSWLFMRPSSQPEARTAAAAILPALFVVCVNFLERVSVWERN